MSLKSLEICITRIKCFSFQGDILSFQAKTSNAICSTRHIVDCYCISGTRGIWSYKVHIYETIDRHPQYACVSLFLLLENCWRRQIHTLIHFQCYWTMAAYIDCHNCTYCNVSEITEAGSNESPVYNRDYNRSNAAHIKDIRGSCTCFYCLHISFVSSEFYEIRKVLSRT